MVKTKVDLTGMKFGRLTVIKQADDYVDKKGEHIACWHCICECGNPNDIIVRGHHLRNGETLSCGCWQKDASRQSRALAKKTNQYEFYDNYVIGYTEKGEPFYVDIEDYETVKDICWHTSTKGYICGLKDGVKVSMHRLIMGFPIGFDVDHIGGEATKNDNRKSNLRIATEQENAINRKKISTNQSGYTGVIRRKNRWIAQIYYKSKNIYLGSFKNKEDAIIARKEAEEKYYGRWSYDNSQLIYQKIERCDGT